MQTGVLTESEGSANESPEAVLPWTRPSYLPALDGIRGIGLFFVMASHGGMAWAKGGFFWVSTFFTLSGYLITSLMIAEHRKHGAVDSKAFWIRRMRRLMPAAIVTLFAVVLFGAFIADATQLQRLRGDGLAALFYVANWRFIFTDTSYAELFSSPSPVQHFWTLSIEEQFYAFLPLVVLGSLAIGRGRWKRVGVIVGAATVASIVWMLHLQGEGVPVDRLYFGTDTRLPELTAGVLLAIVLSRWDPRRSPTASLVFGWIGLAALLVVLGLTLTVERTDPWLYRGGFALYAVVSCLLIVGCIQTGALVRRALSFDPARRFGQMTYSGYLFHWIVFLVIDETVLSIGQYQLFAVRFAVTLVLAWLCFRYVEQPVRTGEKLTGTAGRIALPVSVALVVVGLVLVTRNPPAPATTLTGEAQAMPEAVPAEARRVLVVGDSQAWVLGNGLARWSETHAEEAVVWNMASPGCGIVRGGEANRLGEVTTGQCEDWPERWAGLLDEFDPDVVLVLSGAWDWVDRKLPEWSEWQGYGDPEFDAHVIDEYEAAADLLTSNGAEVVWLTNPCYELEDFGGDPVHANNTYLPPVAERFPDEVQVYDLYADLCPDGEFTRDLGGFDDARPDGLHLSDEAADWAAGWFMPRLIDLTAPAAAPPVGAPPDEAVPAN